MMTRLAAPWSKDTLLRAVRREAAAASPAPAATVIGLDDFAWRRGHSYGSIVVDLERHTVIDILPDRQRDTAMGLRPRRRRPRLGRWRIAGICSRTPLPPSLPRFGPSYLGCERRSRPKDLWIQRL